MKKVLLYIPIVLSFVILGAHFLRYGSDLGVVGAALLMGRSSSANPGWPD